MAEKRHQEHLVSNVLWGIFSEAGSSKLCRVLLVLCQVNFTPISTGNDIRNSRMVLNNMLFSGILVHFASIRHYTTLCETQKQPLLFSSGFKSFQATAHNEFSIGLYTDLLELQTTVKMSAYCILLVCICTHPWPPLAPFKVYRISYMHFLFAVYPCMHRRLYYFDTKKTWQLYSIKNKNVIIDSSGFWKFKEDEELPEVALLSQYFWMQNQRTK